MSVKRLVNVNLIWALFRKEWCEAQSKIIGSSILAFIVGLGLTPPEVTVADVVFFSTFEQISHLVGFLGAALMGMGVIAGERQQGTFSFLLRLPVRLEMWLRVKFVVGAIGLLLMLTCYWVGVFISLPQWDNPDFLGGIFEYGRDHPLLREMRSLDAILMDVGWFRLILLWFFSYVVLYTVVFLSSTVADSVLKAAGAGLVVWVSFYFLDIVVSFFSDKVWNYIALLFDIGFEWEAGILRKAFDSWRLLMRGAVAILLAAVVLIMASWTVKWSETRRFQRFQQWLGVALVSSVSVVIIVIGIGLILNDTKSSDPVDESVGRLLYDEKVSVVDLVLNDSLAVVLLDQGMSVVDVSKRQTPKELGRIEVADWRLQRVVLSGSTAYVWGLEAAQDSLGQDSLGVVVFDLSRPDHPRLQADTLFYPTESESRWVQHSPRLVGWAAWDEHLYAGLLGSESLELHVFDLKKGGLLPKRVQVLEIEKKAEHIWNINWEMRFAGPHVFLTLGHDFVVYDLTCPSQPEVLGRTELRRFGHSKQYEESVKRLRNLSTLGVPRSLVQEFEELLSMSVYGPQGIHYRDGSILISPPLGPISLSDDRAYVQRHWPFELAVVDIGDPRQPREIDYIPGAYPPGLIMDDDFAYSQYGISARKEIFPGSIMEGGVPVSFSFPHKYGIRAYAVAEYGGLLPRKELGLGEEDSSTRYYPGGTNPILAGDHIFSVLGNNLVIFEVLKDE